MRKQLQEPTRMMWHVVFAERDGRSYLAPHARGISQFMLRGANSKPSL